MEVTKTMASRTTKEGVFLRLGDRVRCRRGNVRARGTVEAILGPFGDMVAVLWDKKQTSAYAYSPRDLVRVES